MVDYTKGYIKYMLLLYCHYYITATSFTLDFPTFRFSLFRADEIIFPYKNEFRRGSDSLNTPHYTVECGIIIG